MADLAVVTGASGAIGGHLVNALVRQGFHIRALDQLSRESPSDLPVEWVRADVRDADAMRDALASARLVFHLAAKLHTPNPDPSLEHEYRAINVGGARNVAEAAAAAGAERVVFFSTIDLYGPTTGAGLIDEDYQPWPQSLYGRTKLEAEGEMQILGGRSTILRLGAMYGPGMTGNYLKMLKAIRARRFPIIGPGSNRRTLVHVRDVVGAAITAATHPAAVDQVFNVTDGSVHTLREIAASMAGALGRRDRFLKVPELIARTGALALETILGSRAPLTVDAIGKVSQDVAVSGDRLTELVGYRASVGLDEGWRSVVRWVDPTQADDPR